MKKESLFLRLARNTRQVVRNIFNIRGRLSGQGSPANPSYWISKMYGSGSETAAGRTIDENDMLKNIYFWSCMKVIRETIASLPIILYKRTDQGRERAEKHGAYQVLHLKANEEQSAFDFKEMLSGHYLVYGNMYAYKEFSSSSGELTAMWPLLPWNMEVRRVDRRRYYVYRLPNKEKQIFFPEEILHISNYSTSGLLGDQPLDYVRETLGTTVAADEYAARFFGNDATPGGIIEMEGRLNEENRKRFVESWNAGAKLENRHKTRILEQGAKFRELMVTPEKAQFLETRKYQRQLAASFHRLPPHLIGDLEHATYTNIEQQALEFVTLTMLPHFVRWEQNLTIQTLSDRDIKNYFYEILVDALVRGDTKTRYETYRIGREMGVLSPNDVCDRENMNRIPAELGGDDRHIPMNWTKLDGSDALQLQQPAQDPKNPDDEKQKENKQLLILKEQRTFRAAITRKNIAASYQRMHADVMGIIQKMEIVELRKKVKNILQMRSREEFEKWYKEYYNGLPEKLQRKLFPVYMSIFDAIYSEIKEEFYLSEAQANMEYQEKFVRDYTDQYIYRYLKEHKKNIGWALKDSELNEKNIDERMEEMYLGWEKNLQGDSKNEATRSSNAFAKSLYLLAGVTYLRWINTSSKPCPYCQQMHGQIVGITQNFLQAGERIGSGKDIMNISRDIGHAPLHGGCECQIVPG